LLVVLLISSFGGDHPFLLMTFCWEVDFIFADLLLVKPLSFPTRTIQPTRKPKVIASVFWIPEAKEVLEMKGFRFLDDSN